MFLFGVCIALLLFLLDNVVTANTECVWATGIIECRKNQSRIIGSVVEIYDLDSPETVSWANKIDSPF
jgi:hypothetical protein